MQADYLQWSNAMLNRKLKRGQSHDIQLQEDLAQVENDIRATNRENSELRVTIAYMREHEVCFLDALFMILLLSCAMAGIWHWDMLHHCSILSWLSPAAEYTTSSTHFVQESPAVPVWL